MQLQRQSNNGADPGIETASSDERRGERLFLLLLSIWMVVLTLFLVGSKENVFMDEALSYFRACNESSDSYEETYRTLDDPPEYFRRLFSVEEPFRYDIVYRNETENVHPPLYYYALHTICSLFPGRYSLFFAGAINALFAVGILLALHGMLRLLVDDGRIRAILCLLYAFSPGIWNNLSFLRMYVMLGFWITALTLLFLTHERKPLRFYGAFLFTVVYCGILTHHHFLIYLAGSSFTYLVILLVRKDGKTIFRHVCIVLAASLCALVSFPPMIDQILNSDRGSEAQANALNWQGFAPRIRWFAIHGGGDLFGSLCRPAILLSAICLLVVIAFYFWKRTSDDSDPLEIPDSSMCILSMRDLCMLVVPAGFYCTIVGITASFQTQRYLYAVFPLLLVIFGLLLYNAVLVLPQARRFAFPIISIALAAVTISAFRMAAFPYLYRGEAERREALLPYSGLDCLYLVQEDGLYADLLADYMELSMYGSVTAVNASDPGTPAAPFSGQEQLILVTNDLLNSPDENLKEEIEDFCIRNGLPSHVTDLGAYSIFTHTYLCSRESTGTS